MSGKIIIQRYAAPCGELLLGAFGDRLCLCSWLGELHPGRTERRLERLLDASLEQGSSDVTEEAARQLAEYFDGERRSFDLPLLMPGTEFQKRVWRGLAEIPYGRTLSYSELAAACGSPGSVRAAANANGANAIAVIVPCHRVISADGSSGGYAGGIAVKRFLLDLEAGR